MSRFGAVALMAVGVSLSVGFAATQASAMTYSFYKIASDNGSINDIGSSLFVDVEDPGVNTATTNNRASFKFTNTGVGSITGIYFQDGTLLKYKLSY